MEKRGVVSPRDTHDTEGRLKGEKRAGDEQSQTQTLDDDFTKRAGDLAAEKLAENKDAE